MKTFLKFSGVISLVVAVVGFILMLACPGVTMKIGNSSSTINGAKAIFGWTDKGSVFGTTISSHTNGAVVGIIGFVLVVVALIILIAAFVLPILKVKALDKFAGVLNLVAVCCLIAAGVMMFFVALGFAQANGNGDNASYFHLGVGMILSGILYIVSGAIAIAPAVCDFISKK